MADVVESARAILSSSEKRMEAAANNVANLTTAGFKSQKIHSGPFQASGNGAALSEKSTDVNQQQGRLSKTGNPLDLAINGKGYFQVSGPAGMFFTRQGQFTLASDGRVVNSQGFALQQVDGGDLTLSDTDVLITADGTVTSQGRPVAKIGLFETDTAAGIRPLSGTLVQLDEWAVRPVVEPDIRQGMVEASNVVLADEMLAVMEALRQAETGARLVQVYDDLMGKAVSAFGQGGR